MATKTSKTHKSRKTTAKPASRGKGPSTVAPVKAAPAPTSDAKPDLGEALASLAQASDAMAGVEQPQELEPAKQYWFRAPDSKSRKLFEKIVVMREAGRNDEDIAKRLKTTAANVRQTVYIAKKNGWMDADGEPIDLEAELAVNIDRKVVRNISASLDGRMTNWQTHEMTLAAAKGRGVFKSDKTDAATVAPMNVVQIQIIHAATGAADQVVVEDNVGGVPAYTEGEVSDVLPDPLPSAAVSMVPAAGA